MERQGQGPSQMEKGQYTGIRREGRKAARETDTLGWGEGRANNKDRQDRGRQKQRASDEKEAGGGRVEGRLDPGQAKPGVRAPGRAAGGQGPPLHLSVHRRSATVFRTAGLPCASCPLGSLSMSRGGEQWRKQLQE